MKIDFWKVDNVQLHEANRTSSLSSAYLEKRELIWTSRKNTLGDRLWNGSVYSITSIDSVDGRLDLHLGQCEYKDILIKDSIGPQQVIDIYGKDSLFQHLIISVVPITSDGYFVLSKVGSETLHQQGLTDLIGGTANCDEVSVSCFADFSRFALNELEEEIGITTSTGCLTPAVLLRYSGRFNILYTFSLSKSSSEIKFSLNKTEVASVLLVKIKDILEETKQLCSHEVEALRELLRNGKSDLPNCMQFFLL